MGTIRDTASSAVDRADRGARSVIHDSQSVPTDFAISGHNKVIRSEAEKYEEDLTDLGWEMEEEYDDDGKLTVSFTNEDEFQGEEAEFQLDLSYGPGGKKVNRTIDGEEVPDDLPSDHEKFFPEEHERMQRFEEVETGEIASEEDKSDSANDCQCQCPCHTDQ
jgi:hypothetical protein